MLNLEQPLRDMPKALSPSDSHSVTDNINHHNRLSQILSLSRLMYWENYHLVRLRCAHGSHCSSPTPIFTGESLKTALTEGPELLGPKEVITSSLLNSL